VKSPPGSKFGLGLGVSLGRDWGCALKKFDRKTSQWERGEWVHYFYE
jgi:hypothetical protein